MQQLTFHMPTPKRKRGPGRPRKYAPGCVPHGPRRALDRRTPVHVTMRLVDDIRNARKFGIYRAISRATLTAMIGGRARIIHFSIQKTHLHAIVEADDARALSRGLQGFQVSAAKRINAATGHHGQVFSDRYHAHYLASPTETRNAIRYVLNNWRHHGADRHGFLARCRVDPFSSAPKFGGFTDFNTGPVIEFRRWPRTYDPIAVFLPRTWLLRRGWSDRGGGPFSVFDTPK